MSSTEPDRPASRRTLLRRAAVTGGAAVAATAVTATPASAAPGDPVVIGLPNSGGPTTVTSAAPAGGATLALRNATGATLHIEKGPSYTSPAPTGALYAEGTALAVSNGNGAYSAFSTANATMLVPVPPTRILDTRSAAGRARLIEGAGRIDAQGRAVADSFLVVHLQGIAEYADGMLGNITVANTEKAGFVTVYGRGDRPNASTINWWSAGQLLSNGVITQLGAYETANGDYYPDVVGIYVPKASATALILDVTGLLVFHPDSAVINSPKTAGARVAADGNRGVRAQAIKEAAERGDRAVHTGA
ncbi:hypothetical protein Q3W71_09620 [Micromonospora sp. C28SCA-DRY-2]|uniref:hypothetical protein n=1 Tax=Micromonospora sp. C28SCA-DRY-2 TaxID=3059522 RepID=UPI0026775EDE|nr:hypothetical protein [Micromonospora sp. C28SCA-DRY-2]MDO3701937.1 hypothetical protein [Micromonospora sp. C28SCA-DRY-2]